MHNYKILAIQTYQTPNDQTSETKAAFRPYLPNPDHEEIISKFEGGRSGDFVFHIKITSKDHPLVRSGKCKLSDQIVLKVQGIGNRIQDDINFYTHASEAMLKLFPDIYQI